MDEEGNPVTSEEEEKPQPLRDEALKSLSAFTDFIDTLNLDDLGGEDKEATEPEPSS